MTVDEQVKLMNAARGVLTADWLKNKALVAELAEEIDSLIAAKINGKAPRAVGYVAMALVTGEHLRDVKYPEGVTGILGGLGAISLQRAIEDRGDDVVNDEALPEDFGVAA